VAHLLGEPRFRFVDLDVSGFIHVSGPIDAILHFASPASPIDYLEHPIETLKVGSLGTHKALGLAREKDASFLLASTSEVYGDPLVHPQRENYWGNVNPIGPRGVYDEAKRFSEALTMAYHRSHRLDTKIVRIFNTYGPRMRIQDGRAIPSFLAQSIQGKPLTVFGDGGQTRSFCYIADLVEGIYRLLESRYHLPVNLGNPSEMTILEMAKEVLRVTRSRSKIVYRPLPVDDPKVRQPDISLANRLLHWTPRVGLHTGLLATARDFRMRLGKKASRG
jgi:dTDP-glucose 4,6-dehydratase